jgi:hypothetical protein
MLKEKLQLQPENAFMILLSLVVIAPFIVSGFIVSGQYSSAEYYIEIRALFWHLLLSSDRVRFIIIPLSYLFGNVLLSTFRFIFAFQVYRYYKNLIDRKTILITGALSQAPVLFFTFLTIMFIPLNANQTSIFLPFPIMLSIGVLIIRLSPGPPKSPW